MRIARQRGRQQAALPWPIRRDRGRARGGGAAGAGREPRGLGGANDYTLDLDLQATPQIGGEHIGTIQQAARAFGRPQVAATTVMATRCVQSALAAPRARN